MRNCRGSCRVGTPAETQDEQSTIPVGDGPYQSEQPLTQEEQPIATVGNQVIRHDAAQGEPPTIPVGDGREQQPLGQDEQPTIPVGDGLVQPALPLPQDVPPMIPVSDGLAVPACGRGCDTSLQPTLAVTRHVIVGDRCVSECYRIGDIQGQMDQFHSIYPADGKTTIGDDTTGHPDDGDEHANPEGRDSCCCASL